MPPACATGMSDERARHIRSVAGALTASRSAFPDDIYFEVNGNVLTWIARGGACELKIECHDASEVVDGFYRAEYFLDTSRVLDPSSEFHAGLRFVERESDFESTPRSLVSQQSIFETVLRMRRHRQLQREMDIEAGLVDEDEPDPAPPAAPAKPIPSGKATPSTATAQGAQLKPEGPPALPAAPQAPCDPTTKCIRIMNAARPVCEETRRQVLAARGGSDPDAPSIQNIAPPPTFEDFYQYGIIKRDVRLLSSCSARGRRRKGPRSSDPSPASQEGTAPAGLAVDAPGVTGARVATPRGKRGRKSAAALACQLPPLVDDWSGRAAAKTQKTAE